MQILYLIVIIILSITICVLWNCYQRASRMNKAIRANTQNELQRVTNEVASVLVASSTEEFDEVLVECMGKIARCVDVDRMYIWKNSRHEEVLCCTQVYEWSEDAEPQQGNQLTVDIPYDENIPGWEETLSSGRSVRGLVRNLSQAEQEQLMPQGIISILVVPVFLHNEFWGFVGFDDCRKEREFSDAEEGILRSASLLIATAMLRNEITVSLIQEKETADQSAQTKSDFLSNMSHEIRTPINAITGMSMLAQRTDDIDRIKDCLAKIDAASKQLLGLVNDILDMNKIEAGKMDLVEEPFRLKNALHNVKSIVGVRAAERKQNLTLTIDSDVPEVIIGDEMRMNQILLNLMTNAVKFTGESGNITMTAKCISHEEDECILQFEVIDDGIGISPKQQKHLFKAFEQAERTTTKKYGGTGLGLALSLQLAQLMDGMITVKSALGEGSCFTVQLKFRYTEDTGAIEVNQEDVVVHLGNLSDKRILLVEDIAINREIVLSLLKESEVAIECAENGKEAVEMYAADPNRFDVILMDVSMPLMNGFDATKKIRAMDCVAAKTVPILAMTANAFEDDVRQCLEAGMNTHIAKPLDVQELFSKLAHYIGVGE